MKIVRAIFLLIFIRERIFAEFYPIVLFNNTNLRENICYMVNIENRNNQWCELIRSEINLSTIKTCITYNESLPNLDDRTKISEWIDRSIAATNCSIYLLTAMTTSQKHILTIVELVILFILFLPFIFELCLTMILYFTS